MHSSIKVSSHSQILTQFLLDQLNLFEMYNAVDAAHKAQPQLDLGSVVNHLSTEYATVLCENNSYLALDHSRNEGQPAAQLAE